MTRIALLLWAGLWLPGCRAFDPAWLAPVPAMLPAPLPALTAEVRIRHPRAIADSQRVAHDLRTLFAREVGEVLTDTAGPPRGFLVLTTHRVRYGEGGAYSYFTFLALGGLTPFGFPWTRHRCVVDVQLDVRNRRNELLATYYGQGQAKATGSLYSRTNYRRPERVVYLQCVRQGLAQIIPQLEPDVARLRRELARP